MISWCIGDIVHVKKTNIRNKNLVLRKTFNFFITIRVFPMKLRKFSRL